jgi:hypothetical protein
MSDSRYETPFQKKVQEKRQKRMRFEEAGILAEIRFSLTPGFSRVIVDAMKISRFNGLCLILTPKNG